MPKKAKDYSNTIIYKIACKDAEITDVYVGHTTNFCLRKRCHKHQSTNPNAKAYHLYVYQFIRDHGGFNNWQMVEVKTYTCTSNLDASSRERYWLQKLNAKLNKQIPSRTTKEYHALYRENNKEKLQEYSKAYYKEHNTEKLQEYRKAYYKEHSATCICECGGHYVLVNRTHHFKTKKHLKYLSACVECS
jgi:hypothetical protein